MYYSRETFSLLVVSNGNNYCLSVDSDSSIRVKNIDDPNLKSYNIIDVTLIKAIYDTIIIYERQEDGVFEHTFKIAFTVEELEGIDASIMAGDSRRYFITKLVNNKALTLGSLSDNKVTIDDSFY